MAVSLNFLSGKRQGSAVYHMNDGYFYYCDKKTDNAFYYRCWASRSEGCLVRAVQRTGGLFEVNGHSHVDAPNHLLIPYMMERLVLIDQAGRTDITCVRDVFKDPRNSNLLFGSALNYHRLSPAMNRARTNALPHSNNLPELVQIYEQPQFFCMTATEHFKEFVYAGARHSDNGSMVILYLSKTCKQFLKMVPNLFLVRTVLSEQYQMCTIGVLWERNMVELAWCLVDECSEAIYTQGFLLLKSHLSSWHFSSATCGVDEVAKAFSQVFPVAVHSSLYDYIHELKSSVPIATPSNGEGNQQSMCILQLYTALPLLPKDYLKVAVNAIVQEAQSMAGLNDDDMQQIRGYVNVHWLYHPFRGPHFSVCGNCQRTNYGIEDLKARMERKFRDFSGQLQPITSRCCGNVILYLSL